MPRTSEGVFLAALAVFLPFQSEQRAPTYEETSAWIVSQIGEAAGYTQPNPSQGYSTESYRDVSMKDCKLRFTADLYDSFLQSTITDKVVVPLQKNTSVAIERIQYAARGTVADEYRLELSTVSKEIAVDRAEETTDGRTIRKRVLNVNRTDITFARQGIDNADLSKRVQTALNHAIELCKTTAPKEAF